MTELSVEYLPLDDVAPDARNPKGHRLDLLDGSFDEFGFTEPVVIDERTGKLLSGHGRLEQLVARRDAGQDPPANVTVREDGVWTLPVTRGVSTKDDAQAAAYLVAANKISEAGGWDEGALLTLLRDAPVAPLVPLTGFTLPELDAIGDRLAPVVIPPAPPEGGYESQYGVIVVCETEEHQRDVYERLMAEGLVCRVVVT